MTATEAVRLCKLCRSARPFSEFVWHDIQGGRSGVTARCVACRNRGRRPDPNLPKLRYRVTRHATERYLERVRPELLELPRSKAFSAARMEMRIRMAYAPWSREWPTWMGDREVHADENVGHLHIDDDTVFVLSADPNGERVVVTVLTRDSGPTPQSESLVSSMDGWPDCACGCGKPAPPRKHARSKDKPKGSPAKYIKGHSGGWPPIDWDDLVTTETGCRVFASYEYPPQGYRRMRWKGVPTPIHRVVWEKAHGEIPDGYLVHHRCENKKCINAEHLELMSWGEHTTFHRKGKPNRKAA